MKRKLTPEQLAKLAAGVPMAAVLAEAEPAPAGQPTVAQTADNAAQAEADEAAEDAAAQEAAAVEPAEPEAPAAAAAAQTELTAFLQTELRSAQAALVDAQVKLASTQAKLDEQSLTHDSLTKIAQGALANMQIALGMSASAALPASALVAEHGRLSAVFAQKFPVGGVTSAVADTTPAAKTAVNPKFASLLQRSKAAK